MKFALNDEQDRAARTLDGRVVISAGAGSGKTAVLTERAANALVPGRVRGWEAISIERLLAITFTEKAAGELADRVRGALRAAGRREDAGRVDGAWISTIHGMCARILRQSALEAGIDPYFSVLEAVDSGRLRQQAFERAARRLLGSDPLVAELFELRDITTVADTVTSLADDMRTRLLSAEDFELEQARPAREIVGEAARTFALATTGSSGASEAALVAYGAVCADVAASLEALLGSDLDDRDLLYEARTVLADIRYPSMRKGVADLRDRLATEQVKLGRELTAAIARPLTEALLRLTDAYVTLYQESKSAAAKLDFDDLQSEAHRVLTDPEASAVWQNRFDLTMVDEFQDTDRLQLRLVELLGGERICTVGDEQQSIYRFRGADISVYREHRESMARAGGKSRTLHVNYRSHADILAFVNRVFGRVFGDRLVELRPAPGREEPLEVTGPRVEVLLAHKDRSDSGPRGLLADEIAHRLWALKDAGVPAGDMAILVPRYTHAAEYAEALQSRGIDVLVVGGSRFFEQPEVRALRAFARLVANTGDEEALGTVLTSQMGGFSDDGLLSLREAADKDGSTLWPALDSARLGKADRRIAEALVAAVAAARTAMGSTPLGEVILRAVEDCGFDAVLMSQGAQGGQAYANVLKFARLADSFEASGGVGFTGFSAYLNDKESFGDHEAPATLIKDGSDAVRIMSVHSAKGLEFPVVVVPELGVSGSGRSLAACWQVDSQHTRIAVTLPGGSKDESACSEMGREIQESLKDAEREEQQRLLYVACTRAEDVLILSGAYSPSGIPDNMLGTLLGSLDITPGARDLPEVTATELPFLKLTVLEESEAPEGETAEKSGASEEERLAWLSEVTPEPAPSPGRVLVRPRRLSYSLLKRYESCPMRYVEEPSRPSWAASGAFAFGSAFHAAARLFGEEEAVDDERIAAIAEFHGLDEAGRKRLVAAIERYRASDIARRIAPLGALREAPFALRVGEGADSFLLDGNMDVFAVEGGKALIVDFKTGSRRVDSDDILADYRRQVDCYALAALRSGYNEVEIVFVLPEVDEDGKPQQVSCSRCADDIARIESELTAIHRAMGEEPVHLESFDEEACRDCRVPAGRCVHRDAVRST